MRSSRRLRRQTSLNSFTLQRQIIQGQQMADTPILSARLLLKGGHSVELALDKVDELRKHMAENDGHLVTAQLTGNKELHLFMRDIVGLEIQHEANPDMMRAFSQRF